LIVVVALIGTAALAAQQIAFTALSLGYMPALAFGVAATALVGQSVGAQSLDGARASVAIALRWGLVMMAVSAVGLIAFAPQLVGLFSSDADVLAAGAGALVVLGFSLPATAVWQVCGGALRGSGDTRSPMLASVVATWLAVGLALVAVREFGAGLSAVWLMYTITTHLAALSNWIVLRRRFANYRFTAP
jgi:Na+-driven multidrug efflux pump